MPHPRCGLADPLGCFAVGFDPHAATEPRARVTFPRKLHQPGRSIRTSEATHPHPSTAPRAQATTEKENGQGTAARAPTEETAQPPAGVKKHVNGASRNSEPGSPQAKAPPGAPHPHPVAPKPRQLTVPTRRLAEHGPHAAPPIRHPAPPAREATARADRKIRTPSRPHPSNPQHTTQQTEGRPESDGSSLGGRQERSLGVP